MRPPSSPVARFALAALVTVGAVATVSGCRSAASTPSVASVNFTPKAEITVDDHGALVVTGAPTDGGTPTLTAGSVVTIGNEDADAQRVTGTLDGKPSIDTGSLHTGQQVTVVLGTAGTLVLQVGVDGQGQPTTITVTPKPS
jgi:hypothetical protein